MGQSKTSRLEKLFPEATVTFEGETYTVKPLKLKQLPRLSKAYARLIDGVVNKVPVVQMVADATDEVCALIEACVDRPLDDIPVAALPILADVWFDQNLSEDMVGKAKALGRKAADRFGINLEAIPEAPAQSPLS